ncbi:hypothetical protein GCM10022408_11360 [Hymenobacter fastidiosus]|uniref:PD-(D/E)XK endonuclease-like domain-containing protein n=1 Tax=Hymenobacter fastidiosus TaxID=486264 RepID=A0ABP7RSY8_9BACT
MQPTPLPAPAPPGFSGCVVHEGTKLLHVLNAMQSYTAIHTATGAGVKLRPDLLVRSHAGRQLTLIDFKTTSSPDRAHFLTTIEKCDYDRQAALYLDVLGATRFLIVGVQKRAPYEVWRVELTATPGLIEQGRKKYQRLLRAHATTPSAGCFAPLETGTTKNHIVPTATYRV